MACKCQTLNKENVKSRTQTPGRLASLSFPSNKIAAQTSVASSNHRTLVNMGGDAYLSPGEYVSQVTSIMTAFTDLVDKLKLEKEALVVEVNSSDKICV